jgi:4-hydroxybenzoate polyprenyltransferase
VALTTLAFSAADAGLFAFLGLGAFTVHLALQLIRLDSDDGAICLQLFRSNRNAGAFLFIGLLVECLWRNS